MATTNDPGLAIDTARLHLDTARESAFDLCRLLDAAHQETAHVATTDNIASQHDGSPRPNEVVHRYPQERHPPTLGVGDQGPGLTP